MMLDVDLATSERYRGAVDQYMRQNVDDGVRLLCPYQAACRGSVAPTHQFVEGQASHIGSHYALTMDVRPLRILVVAMQVGGSLDHGGGRGVQHVTVHERVAQVGAATSGPRPHPRTKHMDGTAHALAVLLGLASGTEFFEIAGERVHVFDCYAMANVTLCSDSGPDASGGGSTTMVANCATHLRRTINDLDPTIVVAQGWRAVGRSPSQAVADVMGVGRGAKNSCVAVRRLAGQVAMVSLVHPSRHWPIRNRLFQDEIAPALRMARWITLGR